MFPKCWMRLLLGVVTDKTTATIKTHCFSFSVHDFLHSNEKLFLVYSLPCLKFNPYLKLGKEQNIYRPAIGKYLLRSEEEPKYGSC